MKEVFRVAILQLWRHKFLTLATIFGGFILLLIFNFVLSLRFYLLDTVEDFVKRSDFVVPLTKNFDQFELTSLQNELRLYPVEQKILPVNKIGLKVLPLRLQILFTDFSRVNEVLEVLKKKRYEKAIDYWPDDYEAQFREVFSSIEETRKVVLYGSSFFLVFIFVATIFLFLNIFRVFYFYRKREIFITKILGASPFFILRPFLLEAFVLGVFISVLSILGFVWMLRYLSFLPQSDVFLYLWNSVFLYEILGTICVGVFGSFLFLQNYLFSEKPYT